jgi:cytoskeletal protein CcmA (bactofilin family)
VVFRRDSKVDAFQRQISALRHQLGGEGDEGATPDRDRPFSVSSENSYLSEYPQIPSTGTESVSGYRGFADALEPRLPDPATPPIPAIDTDTSIIAHSAAWNGDLESTGSLHIHGRVEGSLTARDTIFIAEEANVDAVIRAANVTVAGNVRGSVHCTERFEVLPRGKVSGDIHSPAIAIHDGATVVGDISMSTSSDTRSSPAPPLRVARGGD